MKASEILRKLADMMDGETGQSAPGTLTPVEVDNTDNTEAPVMVPPLQQKLEILKKSAGVESHYDQGDDDLEVIKRNAGITTAQQEASDDEPLDV